MYRAKNLATFGKTLLYPNASRVYAPSTWCRHSIPALWLAAATTTDAANWLRNEAETEVKVIISLSGSPPGSSLVLTVFYCSSTVYLLLLPPHGLTGSLLLLVTQLNSSMGCFFSKKSKRKSPEKDERAATTAASAEAPTAGSAGSPGNNTSTEEHEPPKQYSWDKREKVRQPGTFTPVHLFTWRQQQHI